MLGRWSFAHSVSFRVAETLALTADPHKTDPYTMKAGCEWRDYRRLSETIDVLKGSVGAHHEPTSSSQNVKRGSSKCSAVPLASPTLRGYSSSMAAVYDRDPRWECAELKGCTGHIRTRSHRRICHCYCFNMFQYVSCCFLCVDMCGTITLKYHSLVGSC